MRLRGFPKGASLARCRHCNFAPQQGAERESSSEGMNRSLLNYQSLSFGASTAITHQQSPCAARGRCDPSTLKQPLRSVFVKIPTALPRARRDFVLKAPSPKQFRLREPSERGKGGKKPPAKSRMHLKGGLHQKHLLLQRRELA